MGLMNMRSMVLAAMMFAAFVFVVGACAPSQGAIQTAIAQTQAAQPLATVTVLPPTPTAVPLEDLDIESVLVKDGDLPENLERDQVKSSLPDSLKALVPAPNRVVRQEFTSGIFRSDGTTIMLYESLDDLQKAYPVVVDLVFESAGGESAGIGEQSAIEGVQSPKIIFVRCHALVWVGLFTGADDVRDMALEYAKRLDKRLAELVCN